MDRLFGRIQIKVNEKIYLKDPESSDLGKRIVSRGLEMIDQMGLEAFTFRKLAMDLDTAESSIYRYFESKHKLLIYLTSYYWGWLEYQLVFSTVNISDPIEKLAIAIKTLGASQSVPFPSSIDMDVLKRTVINESPKAYLTKEVDVSNKEGFYYGYKNLVRRISAFVEEINPIFEFPNSLISTIIEGIHHQKYFSKHIPSLTDADKSIDELVGFYIEMAKATILKNGK